ncbi:MAG TPA: DUF4403 family protein [Rhizomicrobium sp.]|nr:DUF4403 family protein [Rhizomicrobium sp.]
MARMGNGIRNSKTAAATPAIIVLAALVSHAAAAEAAQLLSEKPPRSAATNEFQARTSTIEPSLTIAYDVLAGAANAAADRFSGPRSGKARIGCNQLAIGSNSPSVPSIKVTLFKGCVDFDWHVNATRNGNIAVKHDGSGIAMDVPVKFDGNGGFTGDLAKAIQINNKNFSGTFVVSISGMVRMDKSFCPKLDQAVTHFAWGTPPEIDIIGRSCLDAGSGLKACIGPWKFPAGAMMTDQINRSLQSQVDEINAKIPCDKIRDQLKQVWKTWSLPVTLGSSPTFFASVEPKSLSVPGVQVGDDGIKLVARLEAATSVSATKPADAGPGELPENAPMPPQPGKFSLAVPLAIPYPLLAAAASANIIGKPVRSGGQSVTPTAVEVFPSTNRLAIGATFRVDGPGKLHGQNGTVWFTAAPTVENDGHLIRLRNFAMTRKIGNRLWALSAAIRNGLPQAIGNAYSYDLSPLVRDARSKVDDAIKDPKNTGGAKIEISNDDLRLGRTALLPNNFVVEGLFDADVSATLGQIHS